MYSIRAVDAGGAVVGFLPDIEKINASIMFSDVGAVSFDYAIGGINENLLVDQREMAVYDNTGDEVPDTRFFLEGSNGSRVAAGGVVYRSYDGRTVWKVLEEGLVYTENYPGDVGNGSRSFPSSNAGVILSNVMGKAQQMGEIGGISWDFNSTVDSAGKAWSRQISIAYDMGINILQVIQNLVDQGMVEARMVGRKLQAYNPGSLGTDRTKTNPPLIFWAGQNAAEAPEQRDSRSLRTVAVIKGDDNVWREVKDDTAVAKYGRRPVFVSQGGVKDEGTLAVIAQSTLDRVKQPRSERTYKYALAAGPTPMRAFIPGDYVFSDMTGTLERVRVRQITVEQNSSGDSPDVTIVLNDQFMELEIALARRVEGIVGGATAGGGSSSTPIDNPSAVDKLAPSPPQGLNLTTDAYLDNSYLTRAIVTASWLAPTTNRDGSALDDLAGFRVRWRYLSGPRYNSKTNPWSERLETDQTTFSMGGLLPGQLVELDVLAVDQANNFSLYTGAKQIRTATDTVAPAVPSAPMVQSRLGTLRVSWDGLGSAGEAMPLDFDRVEIHVSKVNNFTPDNTTLYDITSTKGTAAVLSSLDYATTYYVRLIATDRNGNRSAAGAQGSGYVTRLVNSDITEGTITGAKITPNSVSVTDVAIANSVTSREIKALAVTADKIAANAVTADKANIGSLSAAILVANAIKSDMIQVGAVDPTKLVGTAPPANIWPGGGTFDDQDFWRRVAAGTEPGYDPPAWSSKPDASGQYWVGNANQSNGVGSPDTAWALDSRKAFAATEFFPLKWQPLPSGHRQVFVSGYWNNGVDEDSTSSKDIGFYPTVIARRADGGTAMLRRMQANQPGVKSKRHQYFETRVDLPADTVEWRVSWFLNGVGGGSDTIFFFDKWTAYSMPPTQDWTQYSIKLAPDEIRMLKNGKTGLLMTPEKMEGFGPNSVDPMISLDFITGSATFGGDVISSMADGNAVTMMSDVSKVRSAVNRTGPGVVFDLPQYRPGASTSFNWDNGPLMNVNVGSAGMDLTSAWGIRTSDSRQFGTTLTLQTGEVTLAARNGTPGQSGYDAFFRAGNDGVAEISSTDNTYIRGSSSVRIRGSSRTQPTDFLVQGRAEITGQLGVTGPFAVRNGTKNWVLDHPHDRERFLVHAATEGPDSGVQHRGVSRVGGVVTLPTYFAALVGDTVRTVHLTWGDEADPQPVGYRWENSLQFTVMGPEGSEGSIVSWMVTAARADAGGRFEVEPLREDSMFLDNKEPFIGPLPRPE